jgi:hypothetical protein
MLPNLRQDLLAAKYFWQQTFNFIEGLRIGKATLAKRFEAPFHRAPPAMLRLRAAFLSGTPEKQPQSEIISQFFSAKLLDQQEQGSTLTFNYPGPAVAVTPRVVDLSFPSWS